MIANTLYLAQHGLAVDKTENPERPLSELGIKQTRSIATQLKNSGVKISAIFHSGKLRAQQTAELFASILDVRSISAAAGLAPNDSAEQLANKLTHEDALYVGHLPHLEKLVAYLIVSKTEPCIIKFQNSAIVCMEKNSMTFHIRWFLTPELLI